MAAAGSAARRISRSGRRFLDHVSFAQRHQSEASKPLASQLAFSQTTYFPTQRVVGVKQALPDSCLDQLFREVRTYNGWTNRPVDDELPSHLYELVKLGHTFANTCLARSVWVRSRDGKTKLPNLSSEINKRRFWRRRALSLSGMTWISRIGCLSSSRREARC
jgi:hypothetical protein